MRTITEFIAEYRDRIDSEVLDSLPQFCDFEDCGQELCIDITLREIRCSNEKCPSRLASKVYTLKRNLGEIIQYTEIINTIEMTGIESIGDFLETGVLGRLFQDDITLAEFIGSLCVGEYDWGRVCGRLSDIYELFERVETEGFEFFSSKIPSDSADINLEALLMYVTLLFNKEELIESWGYVVEAKN
ncbi:MAG: hypothetical protein LBM93_11645 [Oscillospiraceae bacterium]|jgi:hypothetical protein|nr:hypothetical protein [Oscillospiraceae bacterium]